MGHFARLLLVSFALISATVLADNPLAKKPASPLAGTYAGQGVTLQINADNSGSLTFEGKTYPVTGKVDGANFFGTFAAGEEKFDLQMIPDGKAMKLTTGGTTYSLVQQKPTNPLAHGDDHPGQPIAPANEPNAAPPAAAGGPVGGVGIAFQPNADGELVVAAVMPGSPADKSGIKPGGYLAAVDGKDVEGMKPEQLRALISGKPGTMVKITIENDKEVTDYVLERADLSKFAPPQPPPGNGPQPAPGPAPMPCQAPGAPMPVPGPQGNANPLPGGFGPPPALPAGGERVATAPAWMKPGVRISFWSGSASVASAGQVLVPDDQGNWVNQAGQKFSAQNNPGAGGMGFQQLTISNIVGDTVVTDFKQYLYNVEAKACTTTLTNGAILSLQQGGELWVPPQKLAALQQGNANGVRILRGPYPLNNRTYNAVSISTATQSGATRYTYDAETGILLAYGASTVGQGGWSPGANGQGQWAQGNTMLVQIFFLGMRQTNLPWTGQRAPAELAQVRQVDFAGTHTSAVANAGQVSWRMAMHWDINKVDELSVQMRATTKIDYNTGVPNEPQVADRTSSTSILWVDPRVLAQVRQGQVLDEDPITNMRTTCAGVMNGMVMLMEEGQIEKSGVGYNQQTGMVQAVTLQTQIGLGTTTVQLQRTR